MEIGFRQGQKLTKGAWMSDDSQNLARWAVTAQPALAPIATPACEIDLTNDAFACKTGSIRGHDFSDEFMTGRARKSVVTTQKLDVCVADTSAEKANHSIAFRPARFWHVSYRCAPSFKVNRNHAG
jgi:hypothetical protein